MVIIDHTIYLEGIKSLLLDSSIFKKLLIDEDRWINYIINLESELKNKKKILKKNLIVFAPLELHPEFYMVILKYIKQSLTTLQNLDLFYQQ